MIIVQRMKIAQRITEKLILTTAQFTSFLHISDKCEKVLLALAFKASNIVILFLLYHL